MMTLTKRFVRPMMYLLSILVAGAGPVHAQGDVSGNWHGVLKSPVGELTLVVTIVRDDGGALRGEMESPDQAPGRKIPLTLIRSAEGRLTFTIKPAQVSYEGAWSEAQQQWSGVFTQGAEAEVPLALRRGLPPARAVIDGLDGLWEGILVRNGVGLRLLLRVGTREDGTRATLDSPDQGTVALPVAALVRRGETVSFMVPVSGARFHGEHSGDRMKGTWALQGQPDVDVTFVRTRRTADREARHRPQTPKAPFPYRAEEITFDSPLAAGVTLSGTLTLPAGTGPFPSAVLITGSGPQDRDGTLFGHKPFAVLADYLTRHGVAVLRYDDRGVGQSTGLHDTATSADFATDANAAVRYLRTRAEIDRDAIGLIGHSEGAMIAPIAALDNSAIAYIVSLAGPGTNLIQLLQAQRRLVGLSQGVSEADLSRGEPVMAAVFDAVAAASSTEDARRRVRTVLTPAALETLKLPGSARDLTVEQYATDWYRYFLRYDPAAVFSRLGLPILVVNGSLDRQVPADENLAAIAAALRHNPDVTVRKLDGLNHLFQTARTGSIGEYAEITETMSPLALGIVTEWIVSRFARQGLRRQAGVVGEGRRSATQAPGGHRNTRTSSP